MKVINIGRAPVIRGLQPAAQSRPRTSIRAEKGSRRRRSPSPSDVTFPESPLVPSASVPSKKRSSALGKDVGVNASGAKKSKRRAAAPGPKGFAPPAESGTTTLTTSPSPSAPTDADAAAPPASVLSGLEDEIPDAAAVVDPAAKKAVPLQALTFSADVLKVADAEAALALALDDVEDALEDEEDLDGLVAGLEDEEEEDEEVTEEEGEEAVPAPAPEAAVAPAAPVAAPTAAPAPAPAAAATAEEEEEMEEEAIEEEAEVEAKQAETVVEKAADVVTDDATAAAAVAAVVVAPEETKAEGEVKEDPKVESKAEVVEPSVKKEEDSTPMAFFSKLKTKLTGGAAPAAEKKDKEDKKAAPAAAAPIAPAAAAATAPAAPVVTPEPAAKATPPPAAVPVPVPVPATPSLPKTISIKKEDKLPTPSPVPAAKLLGAEVVKPKPAAALPPADPPALLQALQEKDAQLAAASAMQASLAQEIARLQGLATEQEDLINSWRTEAEASLEEAAKAIQAAQAASVLLDELGTMEQRVVELEAALTTAKSEAQASKWATELLNSRLEELRPVADSWASDRPALEAARNALVSEQTRMNTELAATVATLRSAQQQITALEARARELDAVRAELVLERDLLLQKCAELDVAKIQLSQRLTQVEDEAASLRTAKETAEALRARVEADAASSKAASEVLLQRMEARLEELRPLAEAWSLEKPELEQNLMAAEIALQAEEAKVAAAVRAAEQQMTAMDARMRSMAAELEQWKTRCMLMDKARGEAESTTFARQANELLNTRLEELRPAAAEASLASSPALEQALTAAQTALQAEQAKMAAAMASAEQQMAAMRRYTGDLERERDQLRQRVLQLDALRTEEAEEARDAFDLEELLPPPVPAPLLTLSEGAAPAGLVDAEDVASVLALKEQVAAEYRAAQELLAQAEAAAEFLAGQLTNVLSPPGQANGASYVGSEGEEEWRRRAHALETKLSFLEQRLEQEVDRCLRAEARIEELEGQFGEGAFRPLSPGAGPDVAMVEDEFLERLASAETEVDGLRAQMEAVLDENDDLRDELGRLRAKAAQEQDALSFLRAGQGPDAQQLQQEVEALKEELAKRDLVIAQAKSFINRWSQGKGGGN